MTRAQSVTQLLNLVRAQLTADYSRLWVRGEVGQWSSSPKGHHYFTLKDRQSLLNAVLWASRSEFLDFEPSEGMTVLAYGSLTVYPPRGQLQFTVEQLIPDGIGQYFAALEKLRARLTAEGLFETARKRNLPFFPRRVGVVTSLEGAVWHDIQTTLQRRNPAVKLILSPAPVQGPEAVGKLVQALRRLLEHEVEVVILARGGGSWEDLMAFNHEHLVRFLARYPVPILTAIGHETDVTLADHVADRRAPTPTAAAELVAPELAQLQVAVRHARERLQSLIQRRLERERERLRGLKIPRPERWLQQQRELLLRRQQQLRHALQSHTQRQRQQWQRYRAGLAPAILVSECKRQRSQLGELQRRLHQAMRQRLASNRSDQSQWAALLNSLSPQRVLQRGYAICLDESGRPVTTVRGRNPGERLEISLADGSLDCLIQQIRSPATNEEFTP